jgi:hypothetical protein
MRASAMSASELARMAGSYRWQLAMAYVRGRKTFYGGDSYVIIRASQKFS